MARSLPLPMGRPLTPALSPEGRGGGDPPPDWDQDERANLSSPLPSGERVRVRGSHGNSAIRERARKLRAQPTDAEKRLWTHLRDRRFQGAKFVRQYAIGPYFADFVCRDAMLVIELDGGQHDEAQRNAARTRYLNDQGYSVLRFWNLDILTNLEGTLQALHLVMEGAPSPGGRFMPASTHQRSDHLTADLPRLMKD